MRKFFTAVLLAGVMLSCPGGLLAADTVKIGMITTLSGPFEFVGRIYVAGVKFAVDEQNAKGGLLGRQIELIIIQDDEFKPDVAVRRARNLILENKINILNGAVGSAASIALSQVADANKTIHDQPHCARGQHTGEGVHPVWLQGYYQSVQASSQRLPTFSPTKPYRRYYILNQDYALGRDSAAASKSC